MAMRAARVLALAISLAWPSAASAQAPARDPSQEATLQIFVRGTPIGTEQFSIYRGADEWQLRATSELGAPISLSLRGAVLRYTPDWEPKSIELRGTLREQVLDVTSTISKGAAVTSTFENGQMVERESTVWPDTLLLPNNVFGAYAPVAIRLLDAAPGAVVHAYAPPYGRSSWC